jgi:hypothetical protein
VSTGRRLLLTALVASAVVAGGVALGDATRDEAGPQPVPVPAQSAPSDTPPDRQRAAEACRRLRAQLAPEEDGISHGGCNYGEASVTP